MAKKTIDKNEVARMQARLAELEAKVKVEGIEPKVVSMAVTPTIPLNNVVSLKPIIEPSIDNVRYDSDYSAKDGLELCFKRGQEQKAERFRLVKWLRDNQFSRSKEHNDELGFTVEKNVWQYLASFYEVNGWPKRGDKFDSVDTAKKHLGKHHPAILYIQSFKMWLSDNFVGWVERDTTLKQVQVSNKQVQIDHERNALQAIVDQNTKAIQEALENTGDRLATATENSEANIAKVRQELNDNKANGYPAAIPQMVDVPALSLNGAQRLQREVLRAIILMPNYSEKAKRLSADLLSELGLAEA